ncbi:MAG: hypothetical protein LQ346_004484 [Caloplaca aetnensis]|nr:MAG: hypothetical protein LQ346_004484 [Caloplaca aetnensis]
MAAKHRFLDGRHWDLKQESAKKEKIFLKTIMAKDSELEVKDAVMKAKNAVYAKDAGSKDKDDELKAKVEDAKMKKQGVAIQGHELREKDLAATNETLANELIACQATSCV